MNIIDRIRTEFTTTRTVRQAADRWGQLQDQYGATPNDSPERQQVGAQIADCVEVVADGIERSILAGWAGFLGEPDSLRRDAVVWRSGRMYVGP